MSDNSALDKIKNCIDNRKSFCFDAGAGSGKTYTLIQTINYILSSYGKELTRNHQKIMVITYTNAATNEILSRIGSTQLVDVSTIHTRLWKVIEPFQNQLVDIHLNKLKDECEKLENCRKENPYYSDCQLNSMIDDMAFNDLFYKSKNLSAMEFKTLFNGYTDNKKISSVGRFREYVYQTKKLFKYSNAITRIEDGSPGYSKVSYTPLYNTDRLEKMEFSHDTLLEYSLNLVKSSKTVRQIIRDTYPYILVDEYQDTAPNVISLLSIITSGDNNKTIAGFYGDSCQNIYDSGVGEHLYQYFTDRLTRVTQQINHRSLPEIVKVANTIRHDNVVQVSYYKKPLGSVEAYYAQNDDVIDRFINEKKSEFPSGEEVHCLVLKNDIVAKRMGFGELYGIFSNSLRYKGNGYKQLNTEVLSDDINKLGKVPLRLYQWIQMYFNINEPKVAITEYIPIQVLKNLNLRKLKDLRIKLCSIPNENIASYINGACQLAASDPNICEILKTNLGKDFWSSSDSFKEYAYESLYSDISGEKSVEAHTEIDRLSQLSFGELINWYNYINNSSSTDIKYHTFHGTKGLGFDNVIVVITNRFNNQKDYFQSYFKEFDLSLSDYDEMMISKRNLLYVAVTRAKKHLVVLYVDNNFEIVRNNFETIFGSTEEFKD